MYFLNCQAIPLNVKYIKHHGVSTQFREVTNVPCFTPLFVDFFFSGYSSSGFPITFLKMPVDVVSVTPVKEKSSKIEKTFQEKEHFHAIKPGL